MSKVKGESSNLESAFNDETKPEDLKKVLLVFRTSARISILTHSHVTREVKSPPIIGPKLHHR